MIIHIVQDGDTVESISKLYNLPRSRIEADNNLPPNYALNTGQAIMIVPPAETHVIKDGATLSSIAESYGATQLQLLRNNPQLSDSSLINIGEELVIRYPVEKKINVFGYSTIYISDSVLRKTLPYLTYFTIFSYKVDVKGTFPDIDDTEIINLVLEYGVAPIMTVNSMSETGLGSPGTTHAIMTSLDAQNRCIESALANIKAKGYVGLNMSFYSILEEDVPLYATFISNATKRLNSQGYEVFVTLTPYTLGYQADMNYNKTYYADLGGAANKVILTTYLWQYGTIDEVYQTTADFYKKNIEFVVTQIDPEKIFIGLTRIAYDWEIPYVNGLSSHFLTNAGAITLANQLGALIEFDEVTQTPHYYYNATGLDHYVWFKDSRSINAILDLVDQYGLAGVAIWTINFYDSQTWLCINSRYDIQNYLYGKSETNQP